MLSPALEIMVNLPPSCICAMKEGAISAFITHQTLNIEPGHHLDDVKILDLKKSYIFLHRHYLVKVYSCSNQFVDKTQFIEMVL